MSLSTKYSGRLFPVEAGQLITACGKSKVDANTFEVKLANARDIEDVGEIHFNFLVNFKTGEIVRNSFIGGSWGNEEKQEKLLSGGELNPVKKGGDFKIDINVYESLLIIAIDGIPFCTFSLRKSLREIQKIIITGDVEKVYGVDHVTVSRNLLNPNENQVWRGLIPTAFNPVNLVVVTAVPRVKSGNFNFNFRESLTTPILLQLAVIFDEKDVKLRSKFKRNSQEL